MTATNMCYNFVGFRYSPAVKGFIQGPGHYGQNVAITEISSDVVEATFFVKHEMG